MAIIPKLTRGFVNVLENEYEDGFLTHSADENWPLFKTTQADIVSKFILTKNVSIYPVCPVV